MPAAPPSAYDLAHELATSLTALLLGFQRLRALTGGPERERALALIERMETTARGMSGLLDALRRATAQPPRS